MVMQKKYRVPYWNRADEKNVDKVFSARVFIGQLCWLGQLPYNVRGSNGLLTRAVNDMVAIQVLLLCCHKPLNTLGNVSKKRRRPTISQFLHVNAILCARPVKILRQHLLTVLTLVPTYGDGIFLQEVVGPGV